MAWHVLVSEFRDKYLTLTEQSNVWQVKQDPWIYPNITPNFPFGKAWFTNIHLNPTQNTTVYECNAYQKHNFNLPGITSIGSGQRKMSIRISVEWKKNFGNIEFCRTVAKRKERLYTK